MVTEKETVLVDGQAPPRFVPSTRFTLALLVFFAFIVQYSQRVNLPIAIVCMVNKTKVVSAPILYDEGRSVDIRRTTTTIKPDNSSIERGGIFEEKQFEWSELQQQFLLGGYWAGYIFTQVPGTTSFCSFYLIRFCC